MKWLCFLIFLGFLSLFIIPKYKENWSNTYSGWPGPLENGIGLYNIPALYPNPKYSAKCKYNNSLNSNLKHMQMKGYPNCGDSDLFLNF